MTTTQKLLLGLAILILIGGGYWHSQTNQSEDSLPEVPIVTEESAPVTEEAPVQTTPKAQPATTPKVATPASRTCALNDMNCLLISAQDGSNATMRQSGNLDTIFRGIHASGTVDYTLTHSGGMITFSQKQIAANFSYTEDGKQMLREDGKSEAEIAALEAEQRKAMQDTIGYIRTGRFNKSTLIAQLQKWQQGEFSTSDWQPEVVIRDDYAANGGWECDPAPGVTCTVQ